MAISISEVSTITSVDARAYVDGIEYLYMLKKDKALSPVPSNWRERALHAAFYHASSNGYYVKWLQTEPSKVKGKKIDDKQLTFNFDEVQ